MRINIASSLALIQLFAANCPRLVNGEESLVDLIQTFKRTANNDQRVVLDDGKNIPDAKDKESFKDMFQGLKLKTKNGKNSGSAGKRAPKGKGSTSTEATCTLCENGQSVGNPTAFAPAPFLTNVTCSKLDSYLRSFVLPDDVLCDNAQFFLSDTCGCCPGICPKGEKMSYPNRIVPYDVNDNGIYDDTCADLDMFLKTNVGNYDCGMGSYLASEYCGCKTFENVCTPCYNNAEMPNLNKVAYTVDYYSYYDDDSYYNVTDDFSPTTYNVTCGDIAIDTLSFYDGSSWDCADQQALNTIPCDCPSIPPSLQSSCSLCFANETLSSSLDPVFGVESCRGLNAYAVIFGSILYDNSCDASTLINELLSNSTMNGRATCCIPKTTAAGPSGKGTKNKAKIVNVDWEERKEGAEAVVAKMLKKKSMAKKMKHSS